MDGNDPASRPNSESAARAPISLPESAAAASDSACPTGRGTATNDAQLLVPRACDSDAQPPGAVAGYSDNDT